MLRKKWIGLIVLITAVYFSYSYFFSAGKVMVTSVSTDGNYAITTDLSRKSNSLGFKKPLKKILDRTANIYSAYFIKNSNNLMWQHDTNNEVIIENVEGKMI